MEAALELLAAAEAAAQQDTGDSTFCLVSSSSGSHCWTGVSIWV
jgi:hypothetical protein